MDVDMTVEPMGADPEDSESQNQSQEHENQASIVPHDPDQVQVDHSAQSQMEHQHHHPGGPMPTAPPQAQAGPSGADHIMNPDLSHGLATATVEPEPSKPTDGNEEMVVPVDVQMESGGQSIKVEKVDDHILAEHLSHYINLTAELDTETVLQVVSPKIFDHFSIFDLMQQKAKMCEHFGAMETLLNDTAAVLTELKIMIERCLMPVRSRRWDDLDDDGRKKKRKRYDESVHIDDMLAMALCIDSGIWRKREPEDIDYYSSLINVENLFPEKRDRGPGRPRGSTGQSRKIRVKKENDLDSDYEEAEDSCSGGEMDESNDGMDNSLDSSGNPKPPKKTKIKTEDGIEDDREKFTCEKCGKTYASRSALYRHIEKTCASRESMKVDFNRIGDQFYCGFKDCPEAKKVFATKEDVDDHWAEYHVAEEDKLIPCSVCDLKFATGGARRVHLDRDHERKFECDKCHKKFFTKGNLNYHTRKHHTKIKLEDGTEVIGETYLCLKCGQTLCKAYGKQHEAKCTGNFVRHPEYRKMNDEYFCTVEGCQLGYGFNSIYGLRQHFHNTHIREEEKYFSCDYCDEKFSFRTTRNKHVKAKHIKSYTCDICGKAFGGKDKLTCHRYTHTGEKPYQCDKCDYKAAKKYNLEMHKQSKHSDFEQKNFLCSICNKQFVTMGRVRRHMQVIHADGKDNSKKKRNRHVPPPVPMPETSQEPPIPHPRPEIVSHVEDYMHPPQETIITLYGH